METVIAFCERGHERRTVTAWCRPEGDTGWSRATVNGVVNGDLEYADANHAATHWREVRASPERFHLREKITCPDCWDAPTIRRDRLDAALNRLVTTLPPATADHETRQWYIPLSVLHLG